MRLLVLATLAGCVPELTTPAGASACGEADNNWPVGDRLPVGISGEGFGEGQVIVDVCLSDQFGDEVSLWQFYGMVVVLDVSTGWCGPCAALADEVTAVWADYQEEGFVYVTMMPENGQGQVPSQADLQAWAEEHGISQPILSDDGETSYLITNGSFPHLVVVGRDLRVTEDAVTPVEDEGALRAAIEAAL